MKYRMTFRIFMSHKQHHWLIPVIVVALFSVNSVLAMEYRNLPDNQVEITDPGWHSQIMHWCPEVHCSQLNEPLNYACKIREYSHGFPMTVVDPARISLCACPCYLGVPTP